MRKKEKEIENVQEIEAVIKKAIVCRLGMSDGNQPYIVPVCFGYQDGKIYIHSSLEGLKVAYIKKNPNVCMEFETDVEIVEKDQACDWGVKFRSVICFGRASFITDEIKKTEALDILMCQYSQGSFAYNEKVLPKTAVIQIDIERMTGKQSGY